MEKVNRERCPFIRKNIVGQHLCDLSVPTKTCGSISEKKCNELFDAEYKRRGLK